MSEAQPMARETDPTGCHGGNKGWDWMAIGAAIGAGVGIGLCILFPPAGLIAAAGAVLGVVSTTATAAAIGGELGKGEPKKVDGSPCGEIKGHSTKTKCEGLWVGRMTDKTTHGTAEMQTGAQKVLEGNLPVARVGEASTCGGKKVIKGAKKTIVGGPSVSSGKKSQDEIDDERLDAWIGGLRTLGEWTGFFGAGLAITGAARIGLAAGVSKLATRQVMTQAAKREVFKQTYRAAASQAVARGVAPAAARTAARKAGQQAVINTMSRSAVRTAAVKGAAGGVGRMAAINTALTGQPFQLPPGVEVPAAMKIGSIHSSLDGGIFGAAGRGGTSALVNYGGMDQRKAELVMEGILTVGPDAISNTRWGIWAKVYPKQGKHYVNDKWSDFPGTMRDAWATKDLDKALFGPGLFRTSGMGPQPFETPEGVPRGARPYDPAADPRGGPILDAEKGPDGAWRAPGQDSGPTPPPDAPVPRRGDETSPPRDETRRDDTRPTQPPPRDDTRPTQPPPRDDTRPTQPPPKVDEPTRITDEMIAREREENPDRIATTPDGQPLGDLRAYEVMDIQRKVDAFGEPIYVVGSAARGERRHIGSDLPLDDGSFGLDKKKLTRSDIDYLVENGRGDAAGRLGLHDFDAKYGVLEADYINMSNSAKGKPSPAIKFTPGKPPEYFSPDAGHIPLNEAGIRALRKRGFDSHPETAKRIAEMEARAKGDETPGAAPKDDAAGGGASRAQQEPCPTCAGATPPPDLPWGPVPKAITEALRTIENPALKFLEDSPGVEMIRRAITDQWRAPDAGQRDVVRAWTENIDARLKNLKPTPENLARLEAARTANSGTMRDGHPEAETARANWARANDFVRERVAKGEPITVDRLKELHGILGEGLHNNGFEPGILRGVGPGEHDVPVSAGGIRAYVYPDDVPKALDEMMVWYNKGVVENMPTAELAGGFGQRLVGIHPFTDGNGRTTQLAMDWILMSRGYPPVPATGNKLPVWADSSPVSAGEVALARLHDAVNILEGKPWP